MKNKKYKIPLKWSIKMRMKQKSFSPIILGMKGKINKTQIKIFLIILETRI